MNSAKEKQFFTVEEANQRLPLVRAIVRDIVDLARDVHDRRERLLRMRQESGLHSRSPGSMYSEEVEQIEADLDNDIERLHTFVEELLELGVELKDPFEGLIDFPTMVDGREAYLCWKLGEDEIGFWHELDAGFQGRQSLLEDSLPGNSTDEDSKNS